MGEEDVFPEGRTAAAGASTVATGEGGREVPAPRGNQRRLGDDGQARIVGQPVAEGLAPILGWPGRPATTREWQVKLPASVATR